MAVTTLFQNNQSCSLPAGDLALEQRQEPSLSTVRARIHCREGFIHRLRQVGRQFPKCPRECSTALTRLRTGSDLCVESELGRSEQETRFESLGRGSPEVPCRVDWQGRERRRDSRRARSSRGRRFVEQVGAVRDEVEEGPNRSFVACADRGRLNNRTTSAIVDLK